MKNKWAETLWEQKVSAADPLAEAESWLLSCVSLQVLYA